MRIYYRRRKPTKHYLAHKELARTFVHERVKHFAGVYGFTYNRIAIRNTRRSWGSCSELGNLNFHYKIIFLPEALADYIIVHELCHLWELNHSKRFWAHVEAILPDYRERKKALDSVVNPIRHYREKPPSMLQRGGLVLKRIR